MFAPNCLFVWTNTLNKGILMARRKTKSKKDENIIFLSETLEHQGYAIKEGPKTKSFTLHDLKSIKPLTYGQEQMFESYFEGNNIIANGSAGTGKSYCASYLALTDLLKHDTDTKEIIIVRSAVQSRSIGHLPGRAEDKLAPFEEPYKDIFGELLRKHDAYERLKELGKLRFMSTSFVRGLTWDNAIVIIDEIQNFNFHEINSVITRLGNNSKVIICGDIAQDDLIYNKFDKSGYSKALKVFKLMKNVEIINFTRQDIIRSKFVKEWICAVEDVGEIE